MTSRISLPYPISANRYWATATIPVKGTRKFRSVTYVTEDAKTYKTEVAWRAKAAGIQPITGRIALTVRMYPQRPQDWAKRAAKNPDSWDDDVRSIDLDNALKVLLDALKGVAFDDDKWVRRIDAERCEPDGEARVEVTIVAITTPAIAPALFEDAAA